MDIILEVIEVVCETLSIRDIIRLLMTSRSSYVAILSRPIISKVTNRFQNWKYLIGPMVSDIPEHKNFIMSIIASGSLVFHKPIISILLRSLKVMKNNELLSYISSYDSSCNCSVYMTRESYENLNIKIHSTMNYDGGKIFIDDNEDCIARITILNRSCYFLYIMILEEPLYFEYLKDGDLVVPKYNGDFREDSILKDLEIHNDQLRLQYRYYLLLSLAIKI